MASGIAPNFIASILLVICLIYDTIVAVIASKAKYRRPRQNTRKGL